MNIVVFDTETTNLEKPFCYNIGYVVYNTESEQIILTREFVVEQVWHNDMLFTTAYYSNKRELYVKRMQGRKVRMEKFGFITQQMIRDFRAFDIHYAYAYNSPFDTKVFEYNCDWFKCNNPFDDIEILDIRGLVHQKIALTKEFQDFCEDYNLFTESGNYSTTAETLFRYIGQDIDFIEEHTALADSMIELEILRKCVEWGCEYGKAYQTYSSIERKVRKQLTIYLDGQRTDFEYDNRRNYKDKNGQVNKIILKTYVRK